MNFQRIAIVFDLLMAPPADHNYDEYKKNIDWEAEWAVFRGLKKLGYEPKLFGAFNSLSRLEKDLQKFNPDCIVNLSESFAGKRTNEPLFAKFLEATEIPFTGSTFETLELCKNKVLTKKILSQNGVLVPKGLVAKYRRAIPDLRHLNFPLFIKPTLTESSEGISSASLVRTQTQAIKRILALQKRFKSDILVEEFIAGRELYVSVLDGKTLPIRELHFNTLPGGSERFASAHLKWNEPFRKKFQIQNGFARGLTKRQKKMISEMARKAFYALDISSYVRFDVRLDAKTGNPYFLEANPNPSLSSYDDFARAAKRSGILYHDLLQKILEAADERPARSARLISNY